MPPSTVALEPTAERIPVPETDEETGARLASFVDAVRRLRLRGPDLSERTLMIAGGIMAPVGLGFILLGWLGAARTPNEFEQTPYLISGGLLGLALVFLGAISYFAHWLTELVKEQRRHTTELVAAVDRLRHELASVATAGPPAAGSPTLVATQRGSMAHRSDCPVVAAKPDLRTVSVEDGLAPCKMCEPYR